ncbi:Metallo-dependent phosphatase-like protein [Epithele typhae]|uniref:Metallo-dependent phosphatase-like protein n=1 Tax=Epithele typhae TaxID=378194 RepID=UPI002007D14F|nr:Metallo-dependent phosphatase-like protein [Epithele typhae]KAH9935238.1 Metallo-dependent phosphatase-like protein [Epithele typhae]
MLFATLLAYAAAVRVARACGDHEHVHELARREYPQTYLVPPSRPLEWGDLNFIHTTDTHGWLLGHQKSTFPEPNYSGDLGDFASFVAHMKKTALEKDVDLLLVDSGDLHDGTGLSDGYPAGGVDGHESNKFLLRLPYDVMAIGNHELYIYNVTRDMHTNFAPKLNGRYLTSNVNITVVDETGEAVTVPVGERFAKFTTRKGRKVTALGVLFDFTGNDKNTTVQKVEDMVKESWFAEAIAEVPDFFLLAGHMPITTSDKCQDLRSFYHSGVHPNTPIVILGGHSHIRNCVPFDGRAIAFQSGRYMETVGWLSLNLDHVDKTSNLTFSRRYLDANRVTYEQPYLRHPGGKSITSGLHHLATQFDLNLTYGVAPHDFHTSQAPFPSNDSSLSLLAEAIAYSLLVNNSRAAVPHVMIANTGSQRYDIFAGAFTKNDQVTASPFTNAFVYLPNVPLAAAVQVLPALNDAGENNRRRDLRGGAARGPDGFTAREREAYARGDVDFVFREWLAEMDRRRFGPERRAAANATLGYVTTDSCPGVGDDILHSPLAVYDFPDFVGTPAPDGLADDAPVDLVFTDFIGAQVVETLNAVQSAVVFAQGDIRPYTPTLINAVLGIYAERYWS